MSLHNQTLGKEGEALAASFLIEQGLTILEHNFRYGRSGEIDLIACSDSELLFIEVKSRRSQRFGGPLYAVSPKKVKSIKLTARYYMSQNKKFQEPGIRCRFDLVAVENENVTWHKDIFR